MTFAATNYGRFNVHTMKGDILVLTDTLKVALVTSAYTFNKDTHEFFSDITNELATLNGYTAGGLTLGGKTCAYTAGIGAVLDANDAAWSITVGGITCRGAVIYKSTGTASTSPLIGFVDFGVDKSTSNDTFTIQWDSTYGVTYVAAA
jgi:hypothetical protein